MTADELARLLDELGKRLGPAGSHVFELAVRQVYIDAITSIVSFVVLLVIGLALMRPIYRWQEDGDSYSGRDMVAVGVGAIWLCAIVFLGWFATAGLGALLNPEYAAIRDLLGRIR